MTVLLTGGTGKTGIALARRLHDENIQVLIASRSGTAPKPFKAVRLDWGDPSTFDNPFQADSTISSVYIVLPLTVLSVDNIKAFISLARSKGVNRFVLLSGSQVEADIPHMGEVNQYLIDSKVEYAVLRPTWFQENFGEALLSDIRDKDQTFSATGDGRIAFVSTADIAEVALEALTVEPSMNKEVWIFGPELLSHDEVANIFSTVLGRRITHLKLTVEQLAEVYKSFGLPYVDQLAAMEEAVASHVEENLFTSGTESKYIGKRTLEQYVQDHRELWMK